MIRMFLVGPQTLELPVLPDEVKVDSPGNNRSAEVLALGEINRLRPQKLAGVSWESHFPLYRAPYVQPGSLLKPAAYVRVLESWRRAGADFQFLLTGADLAVNTRMAIEEFSWAARGGEPGDLYYSIALKEYVNYAPRRIVMGADGLAGGVAARAGAPLPAAGSHVVQNGESLWLIAQKYYGDPDRYMDLYRKNRAAIDACNGVAGTPKYTVHTGQTLLLT